MDIRIAASDSPGNTDQVTLVSSWSRGQASFAVAAADALSPQVIYVSLLAVGNSGSCILVDDVNVAYVP